jgi:hypothetical protein
MSAMFTARMAASTVMSEVRFEVFSTMTRKAVLVTRDASKAVRVAAELNSGAETVRIF